MKLRNWLAWGGIALGTAGLGMAVKSFCPQHIALDQLSTFKVEKIDRVSWPDIAVTFLRCGSATVPECIAVRGSFSLAPVVLAHSAVLVRHPRGTFLYDTGLCTDIPLFMLDQSWFFRHTLATFQLERPIGQHLQHLGMTASDLDFILLSHLHWDHVSGIPDLPGVSLRINRLEYTAAAQGLLEQRQGLVSRLMGKNPIELIDCAGPAYEGFRSSLDLFGDGSIILVPLPGHTPGQLGMFINRANGSRLFLIGDAAWVADNYIRPATMHPFIWSQVTNDDALARQTLVDLRKFHLRHPEIPMIAMHDGQLQASFREVEQSNHIHSA